MFILHSLLEKKCFICKFLTQEVREDEFDSPALIKDLSKERIWNQGGTGSEYVSIVLSSEEMISFPYSLLQKPHCIPPKKLLVELLS